MIRTLTFALAFALAACGAQESPPPVTTAAPAGLSVIDGWATVTPGGVNVSAGYLTIRNTGATADRLLGATSARAASVELHTMGMRGDVMEMNLVPAMEIGPGGDLALAPGGNHLMFIGVTQPFVRGEEIAVQLRFEHADPIDVVLPVRPPSGEGPTGH